MRGIMWLESKVKLRMEASSQLSSGGDGRPILSRQEGKQRWSVCSWKTVNALRARF